MSLSAWPPTSPFPPSNIACCRQLDSRIRLRYFSSLPSCSSSSHSTDEWLKSTEQRYMYSFVHVPVPAPVLSPFPIHMTESILCNPLFLLTTRCGSAFCNQQPA